MFSVCMICVLTVLEAVVNHWQMILTVLGFVVYAVKTTKWGKANSKALEVVTGVIENLNHAEVKQAIQAKSADLPMAVVDAIKDAVNTVDPKKPTPTGTDVVLREALRGLPAGEKE